MLSPETEGRAPLDSFKRRKKPVFSSRVAKRYTRRLKQLSRAEQFQSLALFEAPDDLPISASPFDNSPHDFQPQTHRNLVCHRQPAPLRP
ncbi:MAG: hypothetical protein KY445_14340, partial [Armatimonadetes bacterium]|nr:hypothetical protein [Armatimonadota bacterium]